MIVIQLQDIIAKHWQCWNVPQCFLQSVAESLRIGDILLPAEQAILHKGLRFRHSKVTVQFILPLLYQPP